jgi:hypothetical protein
MSSLAEMLSRRSFLAANSRVHAVRTWVFRNLMDYAAVEQCLQASNDTRLKIRESFAVKAATNFSAQRFVISGQEQVPAVGCCCRLGEHRVFLSKPVRKRPRLALSLRITS